MMTFISAALFSLTMGLMLKLLLERSSTVARFIVHLQVKLLLPEERERYEEEWLEAIDAVEGDAWKLLNAMGIIKDALPRFFVNVFSSAEKFRARYMSLNGGQIVLRLNRRLVIVSFLLSVIANAVVWIFYFKSILF